MSAEEKVERVLAPFAEAGYEFQVHEDGTLTGAPAAEPAAAKPAPAPFTERTLSAGARCVDCGDRAVILDFGYEPKCRECSCEY